MIEIFNITQNTAVNLQLKYEGVGGTPTQIPMRPGVTYKVSDLVMKQYANGVKQDVAAYISKAIIRVNRSDDVHSYPDQDHIPDYAGDCAQPAGSEFCIARNNIVATTDGLHWDDEVTGTQTAIDAFINLRSNYDNHAKSLAYHPVAGIPSAGADPIDLATLLARLVTLRTTYNTHIGAAAHVAADTINIVPVGLPIATLQEAVEMIRIIANHFNSHRLQYVLAGTVALTPIQILTDAY